jgi:hypothetical protein
MSIWTDGLPAWWAMAVAVAALLTGVLLGELHGRGVGRGQEREDQKARRVARQFRRIPHVPAHERPRGERTAAFLNPPEVHHEELPWDWREQEARRAHEDDWRRHEETALALAREDFSVTSWTQEMGEDMDAFLAGLLAEHPVPYLPGEEDQ